VAALLRPIDVDALRRAYAVPAVAGKPSITLAGAVELACTIAASDTDRSMLAEAAARWFGEFTLWRHMTSWLIDGSRPPRPSDSTSAPLAELPPIARRAFQTITGLSASREEEVSEAHRILWHVLRVNNAASPARILFGFSAPEALIAPWCSLRAGLSFVASVSR
jgi:hypothetical protein